MEYVKGKNTRSKQLKKWEGLGGLKKSNGSIIFSEWIKTLQTAYPYGMNDKAGDKTNTNKDKQVGSSFPPLKRKYFSTHGNKIVNNNVINIWYELFT